MGFIFFVKILHNVGKLVYEKFDDILENDVRVFPREELRLEIEPINVRSERFLELVHIEVFFDDDSRMIYIPVGA